MIGSLGDTVFTVTPDLIRTPRDVGRSAGSRWEDHEVHLQKASSEFLGPELEEYRMTIRLDLDLGVEPMEEIDRLREARDAGEILPLMFGDEIVADVTVRDLTETWSSIGPDGRVRVADLSLTLKEYPS